LRDEKMNKKELRSHTKRMILLGMMFGIIIGIILGGTLVLLTKENSKTIEIEECHNETRPHHTFPIQANGYSMVGSSEGDRWEILEYGVNNVELNRALGISKTLTIPNEPSISNLSLHGLLSVDIPFIMIDNETAIRLAQNPEYHRHTKHI